MNPHNMEKNGDRPNKQTYTIEIQYTIIITIVAGPPSIMIKREIKAPYDGCLNYFLCGWHAKRKVN